MNCKHCGEALLPNTEFCTLCGARTEAETVSADSEPARTTETGCCTGYSSRINDPAFAGYVKNTNRWAAIFSIILAVAAVAGFYIAGETGAEGMENPQALYYGLGVGGMFLIIALFTIIGKKRSKTWDGVVVDKKVKKKQRRQGSEDDYYYVDYREFVVTVQENGGKKHRMVAVDDDTVYNYYKIGDRVRHHAGLNSYEKYDKSGDSIIFCSACGTLCDINDDACFRCKCPLLK